MYGYKMRKYKRFLIPFLSIFILLSFVVSASAKGRWYRKPRITPRPTPTMTTTPTATPAATMVPTTKPTIKPTPTVTKSPTPIEMAPTPAPTNSANSLTVYVTYYGWPDNDPAGTAIAYPKVDGYPTIHNGAGGIGTFNDPITFAAKVGRFPVGTKIYVPYIKKYVILEDTCASCTTNWIDIWMESDGNNTNKVIACEEYWTKENQLVEVNPPAGREVSTLPLFNKSTGVCLN